MQRKAASHLFSASQLRSRMQSAFNEHLIALHQRLDKEIARSTAMGVPAQVDWQKLAFSFTFDSICKIAFGAHVNSLAEDATSLAFQEAYDFCNETSLRRHFVPELLVSASSLLSDRCVLTHSNCLLVTHKDSDSHLSFVPTVRTSIVALGEVLRHWR